MYPPRRDTKGTTCMKCSVHPSQEPGDRCFSGFRETQNTKACHSRFARARAEHLDIVEMRACQPHQNVVHMSAAVRMERPSMPGGTTPWRSTDDKPVLLLVGSLQIKVIGGVTFVSPASPRLSRHLETQIELQQPHSRVKVFLDTCRKASSFFDWPKNTNRRHDVRQIRDA